MANRLFNFSTCINVPQSAAANKYGIRLEKIASDSINECVRGWAANLPRDLLCVDHVLKRKKCD